MNTLLLPPVVPWLKEFSEKAKAKLTYFANEKDNAITYKDISSVGFMGAHDKQFVNINEASTKGVEFAYEQDLGAGIEMTF